MSTSSHKRPSSIRRRRLSRPLFLLALWLLGLATLPVSSQPFPSQESGYSSNATFALGEIDNVNLFNGNLVLSLPLGQSYPAGGDLDLDFVLRYNLNQAWKERDQPYSCTRQHGTNQVEVLIDIYDPESEGAGPGWDVSFGKLFGPIPAPSSGARWSYRSPDGSRHSFYPNLHPPETGFTNAHYSTDGTHLRLKSNPEGCLNLPSSQRGGCTLKLELPNGEIHRFERESLDSVRETWRIVSMRSPDALANGSVDFTYSAHQTQITDGFRTHFLNYTGGLLTSVDLAAFGGNRAVYQLEYAPYLVDRHRYNWQWYQTHCLPATPPPPDSPTLTVDLLTRVVLPDGSFYEMDYFTADGGAEEGASAGIKTLRLWTGLHYEWRYDLKTFRYMQAPNFLQPRAASRSYGVRTKEVYALVPGTSQKIDLGTWEYLLEKAPQGVEAPRDRAGINANTEEPCYHKSTVIDPLGHRRVSYLLTADLGFTFQQNRPYTVCDPVTGVFQGDEATGVPGPGPFLSEEFYDAGGNKLREVWVEFESDGAGAGSTFQQEQRQTYSATVYFDDNQRIQETFYSDFDGLGHARRMAQDGDFPLGRNFRETFTRYNPNRGSLDNGSFTLPPIQSPWILDTYDLMEVRDGEAGDNHFARSLYCFEASTGLLKGSRTQKGDAQGTGDLLRRYTHDNRGQVLTEMLFGGDDQSLAGGGCTGSAAAGLTPIQETHHTYQFGARKKSQIKDGTAVVLNTLDRDIDAFTGKASHRRDSAGVETALFYDLMGRLSREVRQGSFSTQHRYFFPTESNPDAFLEYQVRQCQEGLQTCPNAPQKLTEQVSHYDRRGLLVREERRIPEAGGLTTRSRKFTYNPLHWVLKETEWGNDSRFTQYQQHDAFGRPGLIVAPDGTPRNFSYTGDRLSTSTVEVLAASGLVNRTVTEHRDAQGRLVKVVEPSGPTGGDVTTTYEYDEGSRLTRVCVGDTDGSPHNGCSGQERTFSYDDRGFLAEEKHPELGCNGNGSRSFTHDARGKVLSTTYSMAGCPAGAPNLDTTYRYDPAGRPTQMRDAQGQLLKELFYARSNDGGDLRRGKLTQAKRHNRVPVDAADPWGNAENIVVSEVFTYGGRGGRLSSSVLRAHQSRRGPSFRLDLSYDDLGNPASIEYPQCQYPPCAGQGGRQVAYSYTEGALTGVSGFLDSLTYHRTGLVHTVSHGNGVSDVLTLDPTDGRRVGSLSTVGASLGGGDGDWQSGAFSYDPAGNITAMGGQNFRYDKGLRLVSGSFWADREATDLRVQNLNYDAFGNITGMETTDDGIRSIGVDSATNRLTSEGADYDVAGNVRHLWGYTYDFDPLNQMRFLDGGSAALRRSYLYDASEERVATLDLALGTELWTVRGPGNELLSEFRRDGTELGAPITWSEDTIYANTQQVARVHSTGTEHLHVDHLGSTRMITGGTPASETIAFLSYYPFGQNTVDPVPGGETLQFTGHERDDNGGGLTGDLDYMHARYYHPMFGRFLSVDPVLGTRSEPQSWNRYRYASNRPVQRIDPNGQADADYSEMGPLAPLVWFSANFKEPVIFAHIAPIALGSAVGLDLVLGVFRFSYDPIDDRVQEGMSRRLGKSEDEFYSFAPVTTETYRAMEQLLEIMIPWLPQGGEPPSGLQTSSGGGLTNQQLASFTTGTNHRSLRSRELARRLILLRHQIAVARARLAHLQSLREKDENGEEPDAR